MMPNPSRSHSGHSGRELVLQRLQDNSGRVGRQLAACRHLGYCHDSSGLVGGYREGVRVIGSVRVGLGFGLEEKSVGREDMGCTARRR